jgi:outer membrane protein assembly factor BamB
MEPPVSYPQSDSYQGKKIYGKKSGCAGIGCFGIIGAIVVIIVIVAVGYFFALPALTPNSLSGSFMDAVIVPQKEGGQKLWVLTDGSFNFIQTIESPGRTSTGRECYFCKTWTYVIDPKDRTIISKTKTEYNDIITQIDLAYYDGKVWSFTREYGENEPKIEAYDAETNELVMTTSQFTSKFSELSAGLAEVHFNEEESNVRMKTKDGRERIYNFIDGKLYKDYSEFNDSRRIDSTVISFPFLAPEDRSSAPRKKLMIAKGPKGNIFNNMSSFDRYSGNDNHMKKYNKIDITELSEKIYLEGIIYHQDDECAIIIHLDKLGKKSDRLMTCIDTKTGKEMWTVDADDMFDEMKIDEEDDAFSSLFFTKNKIEVKRSGDLVLLQFKYEGIIGFDFKTGKKLWEMDI